MLTNIYRKILSDKFRYFLYNLFIGKILFISRNFNILVKSKIIFLFSFILPKTGENKALAFIGQHGLTSYPYKFMLEYKNKTIKVVLDHELNLPYVIHNSNKLYFPDFYTVEKITTDYRALLTEQDIRSAYWENRLSKGIIRCTKK